MFQRYFLLNCTLNCWTLLLTLRLLDMVSDKVRIQAQTRCGCGPTYIVHCVSALGKSVYAVHAYVCMQNPLQSWQTTTFKISKCRCVNDKSFNNFT